MPELKPIAMPGTHQKFLKFFKQKNEPTTLRVLDLGAGHGAFTKELFDMGYAVQACDLFPELFAFDKIVCKKVDITSPFPYADNSFDVVIAIEVSEHIVDHEMFFSEINRILSPQGKLYISTPNILSLKSRLRFLLSGFFYSFNPLEMNNYNGLQHVASLTYDQYHYIAIKHKFAKVEADIDRKQNSSWWLLILLYPFLVLYTRRKKLVHKHNQHELLLGRLLFLTFKKG